MRNRRSVRVLLVALFVGSSIAVVTPPASAATTWECVFGRSGPLSRAIARFAFVSPAGPTNDSVAFDGIGGCRALGDTKVVTSTIHGTGNELTGDTLRFGLCDGDNTDQTPDLIRQALNANVDVSIKIGSGAPINARLDFGPTLILKELAQVVFGEPIVVDDVFPGPKAHSADVSRDGSPAGKASLFTRIGGLCPPQGNDLATLAMTLTA